MAMVAVGYPGKIEELPEALRKRESARRQRRAVSEIAFAGRWNESYAPAESSAIVSRHRHD